MTVTKISREKGHISRVFFGSESVALDCDLCAEKCIREGDSISPETVKEYLAESNYRRAKSRALWLLERYNYTERRLTEKLKTAGFDGGAAEKAVARLKELGLIDDRRLALNMAGDCARRGISARAAYAKLLSKGLGANTVREAISETEFNESEQLPDLIARKYAARLAAGDTQKVFAALVRKGFSYTAVRAALRDCIEQSDIDGDY